MRLRSFAFGFLWSAALFFAAGCERSDSGAVTAELDEPGYKKAKELQRLGRNQEALSEYQKVLERRGLSNSPETHLELGILYEQHLKDPLAALFHYRKYRELKPNSPQDDHVRGRADAAIREFARTLPAAPMENRAERPDMTDVVQRLQRENDQLKQDLVRARAAATLIQRPRAEASPGPQEAQPLPGRNPVAPPPAAVVEASPVVQPDPEPVPPPAAQPPAAQPAPPAQGQRRPGPPAVTTIPPGPRAGPPATQAAPTTPSRPMRSHTVGKSESLWSIARQYYGSGTNAQKVQGIVAANPGVLRTANDPLKQGMVLKIP